MPRKRHENKWVWHWDDNDLIYGALVATRDVKMSGKILSVALSVRMSARHFDGFICSIFLSKSINLSLELALVLILSLLVSHVRAQSGPVHTSHFCCDECRSIKHEIMKQSISLSIVSQQKSDVWTGPQNGCWNVPPNNSYSYY